MRQIEFLRVTTFLSFIAFVYVLAFSILIRLLLHKLGYLRLSANIWMWRLRGGILILASLGVVCFIYGFIEPYWPSITRIQLQSDKLFITSRPIRIVHISDLHSDPNPRLERRLPEMIKTERPDLIVFTGDTINSPEGLGTAREFMKNISGIAPTYVVKGNWDSWYWGRIDLFGGTGVRVINGVSEKVQVGQSAVWISGLPVGRADEVNGIFRDVPADEIKIFLYHYPDLIEDVAKKKIDLYCAGHTHGGQVALPFYGALITFSKYGKRFESGLHKVDETWLYVNRGIGMEGGSAPRVRFWARPEITVIEIVPKNKG